MISFFQVFNRGGVVLWSKQLEVSDDTKGAPDGNGDASAASAATAGGVPRLTDLAAHNPHKPRIDALVQNVLLEERAGQTQFLSKEYALKWTFENGLDLVFVAVYLNLNTLVYIDDLLDAAKREFVETFGAELKGAGSALLPKAPAHYAKFDDKFKALLAGYLERELSRAPKQQRKYEATSEKTLEKVGAFAPKNKSKKAIAAEEKKKKKDEEEAAAAAEAEAEAARRKAEEDKAFAALAPAKGLKKPAPLPMRGPGGLKKKPSASATAATARPKEMRKWEGAAATREEAAALDRSADKDKAKEGELPAAHTDTFGRAPTTQDGDYTAPDVQDGSLGKDDDDDDAVDEKGASVDAKTKPASASAAAGSAAAPAKVGMLRGLFNSFVGKKVLTRDDLAPTLETFRQLLIGKNVAADIADKLCDSVSVSLAGKTLASFTTVYRTVRKDIEAALTRILTPKKPLDLLQGAMAARDAKRPYTIVFVGVNGVGKSTSLSKVAAYFLSKGFKVGIAACDTFRAGAVEQLRTHSLALNIPLFDRGYLKEAHLVAQDSIAAAKRDGLEVLLIDTAGRMQDNAPLMAALSKLIAVNKPDTVLFVGEALVGNDAVDQVTKFNRCLADLDESSVPRLIDGLVLTKFDTIDDKVGAAISLTYATGQPIVFVGTGQTYRDLKRMNVETLIKSLLK